jgi:hypothetical protein
MVVRGWLRRGRLRVGTGLELAALALVSGCAGWQRLVVRPETVLPLRQQVQVWEGRHSRVLHAVRFTPDSAIGVPFHQPLNCDSCRIALARGGVHSLRVGNQESPAIVGSTLPFVLVILILIGLRGQLMA